MTLKEATSRAWSESDREAVTVILERLETLTNAFNSVAIILGVPVWDDIPNLETIGRDFEAAMNAREMQKFLLGQRSAQALMGRDVDELPHDPAARISKLENALKEILRESLPVGSDSGNLKVSRIALGALKP